MNKSKKLIEVKVERTIRAPLAEVFDAWLNPKVPGNPWNMADKLILNPGRRVLLLAGPWDSPLWEIYGGQAAGSHSAYLDVTKHIRARVDGDGDL